ncbi:MAG: choice-of-anchor D domain-containing protein [Candidatus Eisenbacteria bacterium]
MQSFRIRNLGGGVLRGSVTLDCDSGSFALSAGGGDYALARDEERLVSVRYQPSTEDVHRCTITTGSESCAPVALIGRTRHAPVCALSTRELTFARLNVGEADEATFRITNEGEGSLIGTVSAPADPNFRLIEGAGPFSLLAQQSRTVRVRFQPGAGGDFSYTIDVGTSCGTVACAGSAEALPSCALSTTSLDFGALEVGQSSERSLSLLNVGGGLLVGEIALDCGDAAFQVVAGAGSYSLAHGETHDVTLRYTPSTEATSSCLLATGCDPVSLSGRATWPLSCELSADSLDFAPIAIGEFAEQSFTLTNTGPGPLSGSVSLSCPGGPFSLTTGGGAYALGPNEVRNVTVRFAPSSLAPVHCSVSTGVVCGMVELFGRTTPAPACHVSLDHLAFPDTEIGASRELGFTIENVGGGTLLGSVALDCGSGPFTLLSGGGDFALGGGEVRSVTLRFAPTTQGRVTCHVVLGTACATIEAEGIGYPPPACQLVPGDVDFGLVLTGVSKVLSFDVKNVGGGTLTGTVPASCADPSFTVVGGAGSYALTAGQAHLVQVRFTPTSAGVRNCTLAFAPSDGCGEVTLHGEGILPPDCAVPVDSLDFGALLLNEAKDLSFEVKNQGQSPFSGNLTLASPSGEFTLIAGAGPFSLGPNETHFVAVRYQPINRGIDLGSLDFGIASGCDGVVLRGKGETAAQCAIDTNALDFDLVAVGETRDLSFTVTNLGDRALDGTITKDCAEPDFEIVGGDGPFSLGLNEARIVTVRFAPITNGSHACAIATALPACPSVTLTGFTQFCVTFPMKVELLWGATPTDLDLHLWTPLADGIRYHVFYGAPGESGELPFATLDQDDQDGFGPEQITIHQTWPENGEYAIAVDHFVGDGSLAQSQALLRVTSGDGAVRDFLVPTNDDRPNLWWDFARLDRTTGCLTIVNSLRSDPPVETLTLPTKGAR